MSNKSAAKPPAGWSVELQGLSASVVFTGPGRQLVWCDGHWFTERRDIDGATMVTPAPGVGSAATMAQARTAGCAFLAAVYAED